MSSWLLAYVPIVVRAHAQRLQLPWLWQVHGLLLLPAFRAQ